jgi:CBS domain-containing protein
VLDRLTFQSLCLSFATKKQASDRVRPTRRTLTAVDFQLSLATEPVGSAFPEAPLAIDGTASVASVMELLRAQHTGAALIYDGQLLVGIFTERDALRLMASDVNLEEAVSRHMTAKIVTVPATATVGQAIASMSSGGYRHLPIVDESGTPIGLVSAPGIVHYLVEHFPNTVYNLPPKSEPMTSQREGA